MAEYVSVPRDFQGLNAHLWEMQDEDLQVCFVIYSAILCQSSVPGAGSTQ